VVGQVMVLTLQHDQLRCRDHSLDLLAATVRRAGVCSEQFLQRTSRCQMFQS